MNPTPVVNPAAAAPLFAPWEEPDKHRVRAAEGHPAEIKTYRRPSPNRLVDPLRALVKEWRELLACFESRADVRMGMGSPAARVGLYADSGDVEFLAQPFLECARIPCAAVKRDDVVRSRKDAFGAGGASLRQSRRVGGRPRAEGGL